MPTYGYKCNSCGYEFEKFQGMTDDPVKKCPACGKMSVRRVISSSAGIILKGSGFYQTDYKADAAPKKQEKCPDSASCPAVCDKKD